MSAFVNMMIRAYEAWENSDPLTRKIFFCVFVVLLAATIAEQLSL